MSGINFATLNRSYFGLTSSGASSLFGSVSGTNSISNTTSLLSDYASIKNGSYESLLKSYYKKMNSEDGEVSSSDKSNVVNKLTNNQLLTEKDAAKELKNSASKLLATGEESLFNKVDVKDEDGNVTKEYDTKAIYSAVSDFVKKYNSAVETVGNSDTNATLSAGSRMTSLTGAMAKNLSKVGITVGFNNKLTIDEEKFKASDMNNVKSLFNGTGSYAYNISSSASSIVNSATSQLSRNNGGLYTQTGAYGSSYAYSGSLYSSFF